MTELPPALICQYPFIHLGEERHCESEVSCPRAHCSALAGARVWTAQSAVQGFCLPVSSNHRVGKFRVSCKGFSIQTEHGNQSSPTEMSNGTHTNPEDRKGQEKWIISNGRPPFPEISAQNGAYHLH